MNEDDLVLTLDEEADLDLALDGGEDLVLQDDLPYYEKEDNYNNLKNKPQINGVTLIGNKLLSDLFPDGIIIDGGEAGGWTE